MWKRCWLFKVLKLCTNYYAHISFQKLLTLYSMSFLASICIIRINWILLMRRDMVRHLVHGDCRDSVTWNPLHCNCIFHIPNEQHSRKLSYSGNHGEKSNGWRLQDCTLHILAWIYCCIWRSILCCISAFNEEEPQRGSKFKITLVKVCEWTVCVCCVIETFLLRCIYYYKCLVIICNCICHSCT